MNQPEQQPSLVYNILHPLFSRSGKQSPTSSSLLKKLVMGLVGVAYMCLALLTMLVVSAVMGVGLVRFLVEEPVHLRERLYFDYTNVNPCAVLDFGVEQLVNNVPVGHSCNVRLVFVMPESDYNRQIGMFQVVAESLSLNGDVITSSSRPCMLRYRSQPVRLMQTLFMAVPLVLGITSEIQTVNVPLLRYKERYYHRTQFIKISLVPRSGTPFLPQMYEANLIVSSELPWMKRLVRNWKWTFSVWTCLYIFLMQLLVMICFFRSMLFPTALSDNKKVAGSDDMGEGLPQVAVGVGAGGRRTSDILKQWRGNRGKRKAMVYGEGSDATSMSVTRDDDTGATTAEEVGDSESICQ